MTNRKLSFSQREGYSQIPEALQFEELSQSSRYEFELCLTKALELYQHEERFAIGREKQAANWEEIMRDIWVQFLCEPLSLYQGMYQVREGLVRILHFGEFYEVCDIIEELTTRTAHSQPKFYTDLKEVFERKRVAYRLVGSDSIGFVVVPTTNEFEVLTINAIFDLLSIKSPRFDLVLKHLMNAGRLLREGKDSKSIGESSSAVEVAFRILTGCDKEHNTVAEKYFKSTQIHPILKEHIVTPYRFASDISDGRHGAKQTGHNADRFDAQYIFTNCCSSIQYLINKQNLKEKMEESSN